MSMAPQARLGVVAAAPINTVNPPNATTSDTTASSRPRSKGRPQSSPCSWLVDHQTSIAITALIALTLAQTLTTSLGSVASKFTSLGYRNPSSGQFGTGPDDIYHIILWVILFTGLRAITIDHVMIPIAGSVGRIQGRSKQTRFAEQAWLILYYLASWAAGLYIMYGSDYWFQLPGMWTNYPTTEVSRSMKCYYLLELGFWIQQLVVIHIEKRRKDHYQMLAHHVITCCLLIFSYGNYQTKVGTTILCLMDFVDIIFSTAKILRYLGYRDACDRMFALFVLSWFVTRHVLYNLVCLSLWRSVPSVMNFGCYHGRDGSRLPNVNSSVDDSLGVVGHGRHFWPNVFHGFVASGKGVAGDVSQIHSDPVCYNPTTHYAFLGLLLGLQVITVGWFVMIINLTIKVLRGGNADDTRSDDEEEGEEETEKEYTLGDSLESVDNTTSPDSLGISVTIAAEKQDSDDARPQTRVDSAIFVDASPVDVTVTEKEQEDEEKNEGETENETEDVDTEPTDNNANNQWSFGAAITHQARSTGIRKELLGRIGCERPPSDGRK